MKFPSNYIPVKDNDNLVRDQNSGAILNVNVQGFEAYKKGRERERHINNMLNEFDSLKNEMTSIKNLLEKVLDKLA